MPQVMLHWDIETRVRREMLQQLHYTLQQLQNATLIGQGKGTVATGRRIARPMMIPDTGTKELVGGTMRPIAKLIAIPSIRRLFRLLPPHSVTRLACLSHSRVCLFV